MCELYESGVREYERVWSGFGSRWELEKRFREVVILTFNPGVALA